MAKVREMTNFFASQVWPSLKQDLGRQTARLAAAVCAKGGGSLVDGLKKQFGFLAGIGLVQTKLAHGAGRAMVDAYNIGLRCRPGRGPILGGGPQPTICPHVGVL